LEQTVLVITSDHGEEFLDHGLLTHGQSLYDELLSVPLVLLNSGQAPGRRGDMVGLLDVAPTLLALSGLKARSGFAGQDLSSGQTDRTHLFAQTAHGLHHLEGKMMVKRAVFTEDWKGILTWDNGKFSLFHRRSDPLEQSDCSSIHPERVDRFRIMIEDWVKSCRAHAPYNLRLLDPSALWKLKEMGYL
jgi:arylsulfatase A-like enzyme